MNAHINHDLADSRVVVDLCNGVWRLLEPEDRSIHADFGRSTAQRRSTGQVVRREPEPRRLAGSGSYAVGRAEPALHHARRGLAICRAHCIVD